MGRKRSHKNRALPPNLYIKSKEYFYYKHPKTKVMTAFGSDRRAAIDAALQLNQLLAVGKDLVAEVLGTNTPFSDFLETFTQEILPGRKVNGQPLSSNTLKGYGQRVKVIQNEWGNRNIRDIQLKEVADFLDLYPSRMSNVYRATLCLIWRYAIAKGRTTTNIPQQTIARDEAIMRQPLSIEGFNQIREYAPSWFQHTMDLALESLQARNELAFAKFEDIEAATWKVIRRKTQKHGISARLKIHLWPELKKAISACRDDIASPFIIHKKPIKVKARNQRSKLREHPTQIMVEELSREFAKARDKSGFYDSLDKYARPTFHEIRSLGSDLKRKSGWKDDAKQQLMAHSDKDMTEHYMNKHEMPWTEVNAGQD